MSLYKGLSNWTKKEAEHLKLGQKGFDMISQLAGTTTGRFCSVFNPNDGQVTVVLTSNIGDDYTGKLQPNATIYGDFKTVRCSTSMKKVIATRM